MLGIHPGAIRDLVSEAVSGLRARRQRTALALIGIVIGTASVVGTIIIGYNAQAEAARVFRGLGIDTMVAQVTSDAHPPTLAKTRAITARIRTIDAVEPAASGQADVAFGGVSRGVTIVAAEPGFDRLAGIDIASGRSLLPIDDGLLSAVIGSDLATALSKPGHPVQTGTQIRIANYYYMVVGIARSDRVNPLIPIPLGEGVLIPFAGVHRIMPIRGINLALLHTRDLADPQPIADAVIQDFQTEQQSPVAVQTARQMIDAQRQQQAVLGRLLAAIGGISLLVGGIGVTNVMLMGLMERRSEFGLRMAIGATPSSIMLSVLVEGAMLGLIGGIVGTAAGVVAAAWFAYHTGWTFAAPAAQLPLGAALATLIGILFGLYPAFKAAQLDPVTALRAE